MCIRDSCSAAPLSPCGHQPLGFGKRHRSTIVPVRAQGSHHLHAASGCDITAAGMERPPHAALGLRISRPPFRSLCLFPFAFERVVSLFAD
eukprot:3309471-Alexandrium_andersonii.AAC.1